jgi:acyl-CoA synthetase (AMP-forming)/AMP-acid ligase II
MLHQILTKTAREQTDKTAIITDERQITYNEFIRKVYTLSDMLIVEGLRKGDRVLVLLKDPIDYLTTCYAILRAWGIVIPLQPTRTLENLQNIIKEYTPWLIVTSRDDARLQPKLLDAMNYPIFYLENTTLFQIRQDGNLTPSDYSQTDEKITKLLNLNEDDGAFMLINYEVEDNKSALVFTHRMIQKMSEKLNNVMNFSIDKRELLMHPLTDINGILSVTHVLTAGATVVIKTEEIKPLEIVQTIIKHGCNALSAKSKIFISLLSNVGSVIKEVASQLEIIELHGTTLKLLEKKRLLNIFSKARLYLYYGTPEAPAATIIELRSERRKIDTIGKPLVDIELEINVNHAHRDSQNITGEIMIRGINTTAGYWVRGDIKTDLLFQDGWLSSGDIGYKDNKGYLHLLGRKDETIEVGGSIMFPYDIEAKIHEAYPEYDICVIGIPQPEGESGEIPVLCYIAREGKTIIPSELARILSLQLRQNQIPKIVYRVDKFPKNGNNILRQELRRRLIEGIGRASMNVA